MKRRERNNADDAMRMTRALCVLFLAILLRDYSTGNFGWQWTVLMAAGIGSHLIINIFVRLQERT